jgi:hypothetical protein
LGGRPTFGAPPWLKDKDEVLRSSPPSPARLKAWWWWGSSSSASYNGAPRGSPSPSFFSSHILSLFYFPGACERMNEGEGQCVWWANKLG